MRSTSDLGADWRLRNRDESHGLKAIQSVGASLRYLPDRNPIDPLKTALRKAAERTMEGLHQCVGSYIRMHELLPPFRL